MREQNIVVIADNALFELGVTVGFGAVVGGFLAVLLFGSMEFLWKKLVGAKEGK